MARSSASATTRCWRQERAQSSSRSSSTVARRHGATGWRMPDSDRIVRGLARALPKEFRERVFEPALSDIQLDELTRRRPLARALLVFECFRLGVPLYFWRRGRPTVVTVALLIALVLGAAVSVRLRYAAEGKAEAGRTGR